MKTSEKFKRKVLARWRGLSAQGMDPVRAAVEIGVEVADLKTWIGEAASDSPLFVPVRVEDEEADGEQTGVVVELGHGVRVVGLSVAQLAELARRLS
jgi:hypothetical protein